MGTTTWADQVAERVKQEPGWRVESTAKGYLTAYAPDGSTMVRIMDMDADFRWRRNTLSEFRRAGLDLTEFKNGNSTAPKKERRARERRKKQPVTVTRIPAPMPVPEDIKAPDKWHLTIHARERAEERGIPLQEIWATLHDPTFTRPTNNDSDSRIYQRGDLRLIVDLERMTVITVLPSDHEARRANEDEADLTIAEEVIASRPIRFEEPDDVASFAKSLTDEFLLCREIGHSWRPWQAYWDEEERHFNRALRCQRCKTQRWQVMSITGATISQSYHHPEGYLHSGRGRIVGTGRDRLRLESVTRLVNGDLRGVDKTQATKEP